MTRQMSEKDNKIADLRKSIQEFNLTICVFATNNSTASSSIISRTTPSNTGGRGNHGHRNNHPTNRFTTSLIGHVVPKQYTTAESIPARRKDKWTMAPLTTIKVVATGEFQGDNKGWVLISIIVIAMQL